MIIEEIPVLQTSDERFKFMEVSMRALLELRAQCASGALPLDQLRRVARTAVFTIDKGNRSVHSRQRSQLSSLWTRGTGQFTLNMRAR